MRVYLVLPAFNEAASLPNLLQRFAALPANVLAQMHIFIINDGSTDRTKQLALESAVGLNLTVVDHPRNMGLGQAVQTGIRTAVEASRQVAARDMHATSVPARLETTTVGAGNERLFTNQAVSTLNPPYRSHPDDLMVIMDADDTHDPNLVIELAAAIENGADIAIASRFVRGGNDQTAPFFRRLLSRGAAVCFKTFLPIDRQVNDFTSGFRAYRLSLLDRAVCHWGYRLIEENGFACMVELLLKLRYYNPRIAEVPFRLQYDRKLSTSKIRIARTILQYLKLALRDRVSPPPVREV